MSGLKSDLESGVAQCAASVVGGLTALLLASSAVEAAPAIRTTDSNRVPQCVTPERLMSFVKDRNPSLDPRFSGIAAWYKQYGDAWHVRWDYAFYQMILETNALSYRRGNGRRGDVHEKQNNFAGIGATGHGAPGERFADVKTGVHAQIQHLVAYSGEMVADPVSARTQLVQDAIISQSKRLRRPVTFGDLARRWAADRAYAKSIDTVAEQFRTNYCNGAAVQEAAAVKNVPEPRPAMRRTLAGFARPSGLGGPAPQMLAGPDSLPWTGEAMPQHPVTAQQDVMPEAPTENHAPSDKTSEPHNSSGKAHKVPPVRTIWSRDGNIPPPVKQQRSVSQDIAPASEPKAPAAAIEKNEKVAEPKPSDDAPSLPHFKIGPTLPAPSRLGGPVDAMPLAAAPVRMLNAQTPGAREAAQTPTARFKEIVAVPAAAQMQSQPQAAHAENQNGNSLGGACKVLTASYGGTKTLLVRAAFNGETRYTALTVLDGFEKTMFDTYSKASTPNGDAVTSEIIGEYPNKDAALADARENCPG
jgi:Mannosyl-glycoprotein endo-beta-N-acetylglucosaminidase